MGVTPSNDNDAAVSRETLYQEAWAEPMTTIALKYKVSSSFLARIYTSLNVPRPPRGYWAKQAAGRKLKQPPLPDPAPGDALEWARYGRARCAPAMVPKPPGEKKHKRRKRSELPERHPLIEGMRETMNEGRVSYSGYLKPKKRHLVDVVVSKDSADRALDVANELFLLCEERNHRVMFAPTDRTYSRQAVDEREKPSRGNHYSDLWGPSWPTVVLIGTVAIGLTIFEMLENVEVMHVNDKYIRLADITPEMQRKYSRSHTWTTTREIPSGRFCVQAYSPYMLANWGRQWREVKQGDFPKKLPKIVKELETEAATIAKLYEEGERRAEIERKQREERHRIWLLEEAERLRIKAIKESREDLFDIIKAWAKAKQIEEFFVDAERRVVGLDDNVRMEILERLKRARDLIGGIDALERFGLWMSPEDRLR